MGAGGPFGSLQVPFMGNPRLQTAGSALGMAPPEQTTTSPINGLLSLQGKLGGSATTPQVLYTVLLNVPLHRALANV